MRKKSNNSREVGVQSQYKRDQIPTNREDIVPYVVLGLSFGALALSFYAVTGGPIDGYIASRQTYVAHADNQQALSETTETPDSNDINEILGKGTYDISVKIDDDGVRSYVLSPIQSDETVDDGAVVDDSQTSDADTEVSNESDEIVEADDVEEDDSELSDEAKEVLEEHKSMRLRIKPDRDGSDIYYYVVESGDSLAKISAHFNIPLGQLMEDNHIEDGNLIYVGEVIFMPTGFTQ